MSSPKDGGTGKKKSKIDIEWENRVLCSDGNCIGVIGPDGNCKECGRPHEGTLPAGFSELESSTVDDSGVDGSVSKNRAEASTNDAVAGKGNAGSDDDWENRLLCSDGNCIGVIGPDGKCKECGRPYDPNAAA